MKHLKVIAFLLLFVSSLVSGQTTISKNNKIPPIVDLKWLKANLKNPNLVIVDLRSPEEFKKEHLKGAVNIPANENLFDERKFIPGLDFLKTVFSNAGIDNNSIVVAYDDGRFIFASRFYWILSTLGHTNAGIMNIGFDGLKKEKAQITSVIEKPIAKNFIPRIDTTKVQTKLSTLLSIGNKTIIDGRKKTHYLGQESKAARFGHIPTAKNYACTQNYSSTKYGNKMKDFKELKTLYKDLSKEKEIVLYCDGGSESSLNFLVLQELGYKVSVYDGSWLEWGNDPKVPIENVSAKQ